MKRPPGPSGKLRGAVAAVALSFALPAMAAQGASRPCLSPADVRAMASFALPSALKGLVEHCSPNVSATGYLRSEGPGLVARYAAGRQAAWPAARRAILQIAGDKDPQAKKAITGLPEEALQPFVEGMISGLIGSELKPGQCVLAEQVVRLLAQLPPENMVELVGLLVQLGAGNGKKGPSELVLCPT